MRWRDDQRKHVGHFTAVQNALIYPPPPTGPRGKLRLGSQAVLPLSGQEHK